MIQTQFKSHIHTSRGYTLLFSVLTATLVLGVAVFILGVSKKQLALSVASRDSTFAIYAADSALECAIAAFNNGQIASSTGGNVKCNSTDSSPMLQFSVKDNGDPIPYDYPLSLLKTKITQGNTTVHLADNTCAVVIFTMGLLDNGSAATVIDSRGYNFCTDDGPDASSSRTVERALRLTKLGIFK